jgi:hypothetical protein
LITLLPELLARDASVRKQNSGIDPNSATVRHRTVRTKGALSAKTAKLMVFKLVNAAAKIQTRQRRRKNMATIEGRKSVAKSRPRHQIPKRHEVINLSAHHAA